MDTFLRWLTSDDVFPYAMGGLGVAVLVVVWRLARTVGRRRDGLQLMWRDETPDDDDTTGGAS